MAQIRPTTWPDLEKNISRLGYRFPTQIKQQLAAVRAIFSQGVLHPYIAQIPNTPPLILVKGPLFGPTDPAVPRGAPPVEFVVTLSQEFPNAYPIMTIELPPAGNVIKNHPNVNHEGCIFLQSISAWNPRTSQLDQCLKDLYVAFKNNFPFVPVQQQRQQPQQPQQQQAAMPSQTLAMGAQISSALAATASNRQPAAQGCSAAPLPPQSSPSSSSAAGPPQALQHQAFAGGAAIGAGGAAAAMQQQQRQPSNSNNMQYQQQQQQPSYQTNQQYDFNKGDFEGMLSGAAKPPGTLITVPAGFGLPALVAAPPNMPMRLSAAAPYPLPAVLEPTPDERYRMAVVQAEAERERESRNSSGFGGLLKSVKGAATSAKNAVEDKLRESVKQNDVERFNKLFPAMRSEHLMTTYVCSTLIGNGAMRKGHVFVTSVGVHFTTKPTTEPAPNDPPRPPEFTCSLPLRGIVSLQLGSEGARKWLHLVCIDGTVRSFVDVIAGWTGGSASSYASASLADTPYDRLYNWLDHAWRAATMVPHPQYPYGPPMSVGGAQQQQQQYQPSSSSTGGMGGSQRSAAPAPLAQPAPTAPVAISTPTGGSSAQQQTTSVSDENLCCVCMEQPRNCFFRPCGHVSTCMGCGGKMSTCPICRTAVTETFQAFL